MNPHDMLASILRETETRLKAFDRHVTETAGYTSAIAIEWRQLRSGLYITLGAAYGGALKRDPVEYVCSACGGVFGVGRSQSERTACGDHAAHQIRRKDLEQL